MDKTLVLGGFAAGALLLVFYVVSRPSAAAPALTPAPEPTTLPIQPQDGDSAGGVLSSIFTGLAAAGTATAGVIRTVRDADRADAAAARAEDRADRRLSLEELLATRGQTANGSTSRGT